MFRTGNRWKRLSTRCMMDKHSKIKANKKKKKHLALQLLLNIARASHCWGAAWAERWCKVHEGMVGKRGVRVPALELVGEGRKEEEAPAGPGGDPTGALILSTVAKGLVVSGIIQRRGRLR